MDIDTRDRSELKAFFVKNAIPTEGNFADLIDGVLNQKEDGIVKLPQDPLAIEASGDAASQKKTINFYEGFNDPQPAWVLSLNPRSEPGDESTARAGFSIGDADGDSKLFVDKSNGHVGVGTIAPADKLTVEGGDVRIAGGRHRRLKIVSDQFWAGLVLVAREQGEAGNPHVDFTHGDLETGDFGMRLHAPSNDLLEVRGGPLRARDGLTVNVNRADHLEVDGAFYRTGGNVYITVDNNLYVRDRLGTAHFRFETNTGRLTVGSIRQESWKAPTLINSWANYGGSYNRCGYFKDSMGVVHLRGLVRNGTIGQVIFRLPSGYRPPGRELHSSRTAGEAAAGRIDVLPSGNVLPVSGSASWISLDGITFRATGAGVGVVVGGGNIGVGGNIGIGGGIRPNVGIDS